MGQEYNRGRSGQGPCSKLIGSKLGRDSWRMLVGLEVSFDFLKIRDFWEIGLSVSKYHFSEGTCMRFSIFFVPF